MPSHARATRLYLRPCFEEFDQASLARQTLQVSNVHSEDSPQRKYATGCSTRSGERGSCCPDLPCPHRPQRKNTRVAQAPAEPLSTDCRLHELVAAWSGLRGFTLDGLPLYTCTSIQIRLIGPYLRRVRNFALKKIQGHHDLYFLLTLIPSPSNQLAKFVFRWHFSPSCTTNYIAPRAKDN